MNEIKYFRVDMEYTQQTSLLIAAETAEQADELVVESIDPSVQGFRILATTEVSPEEKDKILSDMTDTPRTLN